MQLAQPISGARPSGRATLGTSARHALAPMAPESPDGPTAESSDDALMARFCAGDEAAFDLLYARHSGPLLSYLKRFVRDPALAEDLLQTTFLSVVRARGRYEPGSGVRAWFFAIAANASRDALRRRKARPEDLATAALPEATGEQAWPDPPAARAIEAALDALPVEQREAVLLHKLHGFSFPEIGAALGVSAAAAKVRAHRGYTKLKALLSPLAGSEADASGTLAEWEPPLGVSGVPEEAP